MKFDMGGAACAGYGRAVAELNLPINVVGVVATANVPSKVTDQGMW